MPLPPCVIRKPQWRSFEPLTCSPDSGSPLLSTSSTAHCSRRPSRTYSPEVEGLLPTVSPEHIRRLVASASHNAQLQREHTPAVFDGAALLFSAARDGHGSAAAESWSGYVRSITEHAVDSTHWRICAPDALAVIGPIIADHLRHSEMPPQQVKPKDRAAGHGGADTCGSRTNPLDPYLNAERLGNDRCARAAALVTG